ncbi:PRC-barrel domain containing protein [Euhalothece natronophila Z-M001]|uniref:PRC-barrel domain containing protein n=1 Tax=Euhalothece natronophila Z-M001 TaxID=522448 RepID=A0A5B8NPB0_9CHRO|nr:PRC-barrel domain-containing protein [Euhalothece natronophila]QDZ41133.1 PRC-barrel domain containing protein [Euhalothece natronophila Z-M001]
MTSEFNRLRSEVINTQVITRNSGKRLGVVKEMLVDIDRREVVALGLRDNLISVAGMPRYMYLEDITQSGDVILVENEEVIEDVEIEALSALINCEVITEDGEMLGRVRDFQFNMEDGKVSSLIIASWGYPQIPDQVLSTYELPIEEIVSSGPNRIIVFEGAEERLTQLTVGILERLGIGRAPWEKDDDDLYYTPPTARPENQLGTGLPEREPEREERPPMREERRETREPIREPVYEEAWTEEEWEEPEPLPRREEESIRYQEAVLEEDNWGDEEASYEPEPLTSFEEEDDMEEDVWKDEDDSYVPPKVNLPEKEKSKEKEKEKEPEYEEFN